MIVKDKLKMIKAFILGVVLVLGATYAYTWTGPTALPPNNNAPAPVNVSSVSQYKAGALGVGGLFRSYGGSYLATDSGSVGIGTTAISVGQLPLKLDVEGAVGASAYCDKNGNNCVADLTSLGASTPGSIVAGCGSSCAQIDGTPGICWGSMSTGVCWGGASTAVNTSTYPKCPLGTTMAKIGTEMCEYYTCCSSDCYQVSESQPGFVCIAN